MRNKIFLLTVLFIFVLVEKQAIGKDSPRLSLGLGVFNYMEDGTPPHNIQSQMMNFEIHSGKKLNKPCVIFFLCN